MYKIIYFYFILNIFYCRLVAASVKISRQVKRTNSLNSPRVNYPTLGSPRIATPTNNRRIQRGIEVGTCRSISTVSSEPNRKGQCEFSGGGGGVCFPQIWNPAVDECTIVGGNFSPTNNCRIEKGVVEGLSMYVPLSTLPCYRHAPTLTQEIEDLGRGQRGKVTFD